MNKKTKINEYNVLLNNIGTTLSNAKENAFEWVQLQLLNANWQIGKYIVVFEQRGKEKADYGSALLERLATDLKSRYGKGFSKSNIYLMRQFYLKFPIFQTSGKLAWSHFAELLTVTNDLSRKFYLKQCIKENWSVRELKRQINSSLFERLALSTNKKGVLKLA